MRLQGTRVLTTPGHVGLRLEPDRLLGLLEQNNSVVRAPFAVDRAAGHDRRRRRPPPPRPEALVAAPVAIDYHGANRGVLTPTQIARAVRITPAAQGLDVSLEGVEPRRDPAAASRQVDRARTQRALRRQGERGARRSVASRASTSQPYQVATAVEAAAAEGGAAELTLGPRAPDLTTAKAKALGIRKKLVSYTTEMGPSSSNRIHNVHLMADFIDGTVIQPGEVFSFNRVVGPRTAKRGFLEGSEIIGSLVLPSIGGGVCQTATTLFNDAFEAGLPILERTNHNLYLSHYPLGRDATVSWGGPDLKFKNDLKHGILVKASYTDATLTFTFYGTSGGQARRRAHRAAGELDAPGAELRRRPARGPELGSRRAGQRRARLRRHRHPHRLQQGREGAAPQHLQVALHPGQLHRDLRPRQAPARPVLRPAAT